MINRYNAGDDEKGENKVNGLYNPDEERRLSDLLVDVKTLSDKQWEYLVKERERKITSPVRILSERYDRIQVVDKEGAPVLVIDKHNIKPLSKEISIVVDENRDEVNQARGNHQYSTKARYKFLVRFVGQTVDYITSQLDGLTDRELQLFIQMLATSLRFEYGFTKMEGSANEK